MTDYYDGEQFVVVFIQNGVQKIHIHDTLREAIDDTQKLLSVGYTVEGIGLEDEKGSLDTLLTISPFKR